MNNEISLLKLIKNLNHKYNKDSYTIELTDNNHFILIKKNNAVRQIVNNNKSIEEIESDIQLHIALEEWRDAIDRRK